MARHAHTEVPVILVLKPEDATRVLQALTFARDHWYRDLSEGRVPPKGHEAYFAAIDHLNDILLDVQSARLQAMSLQADVNRGNVGDDNSNASASNVTSEPDDESKAS